MDRTLAPQSHQTIQRGVLCFFVIGHGLGALDLLARPPEFELFSVLYRHCYLNLVFTVSVCSQT